MAPPTQTQENRLAKFEKTLLGEVVPFLDQLDRAIASGSMTASFEDSAGTQIGDAVVAVRVYERFSALGQNRVSLNVTVVNWGPQLYVCAITSGGSTGIVKLLPLGERAFLDKAIRAIESFSTGSAGLR
jgi:Family of unknown function (DUF6054)